MSNDDLIRLYGKRDHMAQGEHYIKHVSAMTGEALHAKSDIAGELAHRDIRIAELEAQLDELIKFQGQAVAMAETIANLQAQLARYVEIRREYGKPIFTLKDEK